jgi:hypothetical protein
MGQDGTSGPTHSTGVRRGEELKDEDGKESGREETGKSHADRPTGTSSARDSTMINPEDVESSSGGPSMPPA